MRRFAALTARRVGPRAQAPGEPAPAPARLLGRSALSKRCLARPEAFPSQVASQLRHGDLLFACEPLDLALPLDRAIREVGTRTIEWLAARGPKPSGDETAEHVGLVVADASGHATSVIEAVRLLGVRNLALEGFFAEFAAGTRFFRGRLEGVTTEQCQKAVAYASRRVGANYASRFAPPSSLATTPWTQEFYCSSIVDYAYRDALEQDLVFTNEPFPLMFQPRDFWEEYYRSQDLELPSGFGSNPTLLMHSPRVKCVELDLNAPEPVEETHEMF